MRLNLKSILPVSAVSLAIAGAFAANTKTVTSERPDVIGWASLPGQAACSQEVPCKTEAGPLCRILHNGVFYTAYPKDVNDDCDTSVRLNMRN